jgi:hypothetical protein
MLLDLALLWVVRKLIGGVSVVVVPVRPPPRVYPGGVAWCKNPHEGDVYAPGSDPPFFAGSLSDGSPAEVWNDYYRARDGLTLIYRFGPLDSFTRDAWDEALHVPPVTSTFSPHSGGALFNFWVRGRLAQVVSV